MNRDPSQATVGWKLSIGAAVLLVAGWWFWTRQEVQLDDNSWNLAVALYSACNRQNEKQLQAVAKLWQEQLDLTPDGSASLESLQQIIETAEAGQWREATRRCHEVMQAQRPST